MAESVLGKLLVDSIIIGKKFRCRSRTYNYFRANGATQMKSQSSWRFAHDFGVVGRVGRKQMIVRLSVETVKSFAKTVFVVVGLRAKMRGLVMVNWRFLRVLVHMRIVRVLKILISIIKCVNIVARCIIILHHIFVVLIFD